MTDSWSNDRRYAHVLEVHGTSLLRLAILMTGSRHDGEDALQNAIVSVGQSWDRHLPERPLAYMRRVVTNESLRIIRNRRDIPMEGLPEHGYSELRFLRTEEDQEFFGRLAGLPEKQRATLVLRYYADLDDRRIAQLLDCSVETVRSQAHRGLEKLRASSSLPAGRTV